MELNRINIAKTVMLEWGIAKEIVRMEDRDSGVFVYFKQKDTYKYGLKKPPSDDSEIEICCITNEQINDEKLRVENAEAVGEFINHIKQLHQIGFSSDFIKNVLHKNLKAIEGEAIE